MESNVRIPRFLASLGAMLLVLEGLGRFDPLVGYVHPLNLLTVNLFTVYYGWRQGLVAASASMLLLLVNGWSDENAIFQLYFQSLVLGLVADSLRASPRLKSQLLLQGADLMEATEKLEVLQSANQQLKTELERLDSVQGALARVAEQVLALHREEEIHNALLTSAASQFGATRAALFGQEGEELRVLASIGWSDRPAQILASQAPLVAQAYEEKVLRSLQNYPIQDPSGSQPAWLWACPLIHPTYGRVMAVLTMDRIPFQRFTRGNAAILEAMCGLGARALAEAQGEPGREESDSQALWQEMLGPSDFLRRLRKARLELAQGGSSPFCLLSLQTGLDRNWGERAALMIARCNLRPEDLAGKNRRGDLVFLLLNTRGHSARRILSQIAQQLVEFPPRWHALRAQASGPAPTYSASLVEGHEYPDAEELLEAAEKGLKPCHLILN